jgi:hypothetical protein
LRNIILLSVITLTSLNAQAEEGDWELLASVTYGPRSIDGTIFVNRPGPTSGGGTADSLGLGTSDSFMYAAGFRYKRWNFMLESMPTTFEGQGFATESVDFGNGSSISIETPVNSSINVDLLLVNVMYDFIKSDKAGKLSAGFGLGESSIDVALTPKIGQSVSFNGTTPFGFLGVNYVKRFGKFSVTAGAQGISVATDSSSIDYSNLNLMGGYQFYKNRGFGNVIFGYRRVGFKFDNDVNGGITDTDVVLTGPYIGVGVGF